MFIYLSKKIAIPNGVKLNCISWNTEHGWIACGGENGLLKVLKLESNPNNTNNVSDKNYVRGVAAPSELTMNQTLAGHSGNVVCATWNASHRKLTTSDDNGLIIVWMLHRGMWFEEMINNRNKSIVTDMKWTPDGQKICIVYKDGAVILGSVDGNRLWGKELNLNLSLVEWSPTGKNIFFVTMEGEIHMFDAAGNNVTKLQLHALESRGSKDHKIMSVDWYKGSEGYMSEDVPTLAISFREGVIQITRSELDNNPVLIETGLDLKKCLWNTQGTTLAVAGKQLSHTHQSSSSSESKSINVVQFYNPYGRHLRSLRVPGTCLESLSWDGSGLRLGLAVDSYIYFANIRPQYMWGYFNRTVVYNYNKPNCVENCVVFWDTSSDERHTKYVKSLMDIQGSGDNCILVSIDSTLPRNYRLTLCDSIGSPLDSKSIEVYPKFVTMTRFHVVVASDNVVYTWQYRTPISKLSSVTSSSSSSSSSTSSSSLSAEMESLHLFRSKEGREKIFHIDDLPKKSVSDIETFQYDDRREIIDPIAAVCASATMLIVARVSGSVHRFTLPHISLEAKFELNSRPRALTLNCDSTKMAIIDIHDVCTIWDFNQPGKASVAPASSMKSTGMDNLGEIEGGLVDGFERKDCWSVTWALDDPTLLVTQEKARLIFFRDYQPAEPILSSGYVCCYQDLSVKSVLLDEIMGTPEQPEKEMIVVYEGPALQEVHDRLNNLGLEEACTFIEGQTFHHPKLWQLLAEASLEKMDFQMAERSFIQSRDYASLQVVHRILSLDHKMKQKAEVAVYFKRYDEAEAIYREMDRKELAIDLRVRLGDWFRVVQLVQTGGGNDKLLQQAWNEIGEYYAERQKWSKAAQYYAQAKNTEALIRCYYITGEFQKLIAITQTLPDESPWLSDVGQKLQTVGLTEAAVTCYVKSGDVKAALDCCVLLNDWERAVQLAEAHNFPQIEGVLIKYATSLLEKKNQTAMLQAIELYRRANKSTDAAKLLAQLAKQTGRDGNNPLRAKKLYVLAALEVEKFRKRMLDLQTTTNTTTNTNFSTHFSTNANANTRNGGGTGSSTKLFTSSSAGGAAASTTAQSLASLMQHDAATGENRVLDHAWRGAEAYHLLLLAHRQLYRGYADQAYLTAMKLTDFEDVLDTQLVYSMIALTSFYVNSLKQCSLAFVKLESLAEVSLKERRAYSDLALALFATKSPANPHPTSDVKCPSCKNELEEWSVKCNKCSRSFQTCMATGVTILSQRLYMCKVCRHSTLENELRNRENCPLCHAAII